MVLYGEDGRPEFYDINYLIKIVRLISDIHYASGFINSLKWEGAPSEANIQLAGENTERAIAYLKQYKELAPKKLQEQVDLTTLEAQLERFLDGGLKALKK